MVEFRRIYIELDFTQLPPMSRHLVSPMSQTILYNILVRYFNGKHCIRTQRWVWNKEVDIKPILSILEIYFYLILTEIETNKKIFKKKLLIRAV